MLLVNFLIVTVYVYGGRFQRVSFLRIEKLRGLIGLSQLGNLFRHHNVFII